MLRRQHIENLYGQCRCCLSNGPLRYMWEQYKDANSAEVEVYGKMIVDCYAISWTILETADDDKICEKCVLKLREALNFKKEVVRSQEALLLVFEEHNPEMQEPVTLVIEENNKTKLKLKRNSKKHKPKETEYPTKFDTPKVPEESNKVEVQSIEDENLYEIMSQNDDGEPLKKKSKVSGSYKSVEQLRDDILSKHRDNIRSILIASNATPIRGYWGEGYTCSFCANQFTSAISLKQHTFSHEDTPFKFKVRNLFEHTVKLDITDLKCNICETDMESLQCLMEHIANVHQMPMHLDIPNHIIPFKFDSESLHCVECGQKFESFKNLTEHMTDAHYRNYECAEPSCSKAFINFQSLKTHSISHGTSIFASSVCGKVFSTKLETLEHEKMHLTEQMECSYSNQELAEKKLRAEQNQKVFSDRVICAHCPEMFNGAEELLEHVKEVHFERKYKCSVCGMKFYLKQGLQNHLERQHCLKVQQQCPICPAVCNSMNAMKIHMATHSVEYKHKFQCEVCEMKFQLEANYLGHMANEHGLEQ